MKLKGVKTFFDPNDLAAILKVVFETMFKRGITDNNGETDSANILHCVSGFIALVAFMKGRHCINVDQSMSVFFGSLVIQFPANSEYLYFLSEIISHLYLLGVHTDSQLVRSVGQVITPEVSWTFSNHRHTRGILSLQNPPPVIGLVITVPRCRLQPIYNKCFIQMENVHVTFQIRLFFDDRMVDIYWSVLPIFGTLRTSTDGHNCQIDRDTSGWHGSSDMHLCLYVATNMLLRKSPHQAWLSVNLYAEKMTKALFRDDYGDNLEVYKSRLLDDTKIQLVKSILGVKPPNPVDITQQHQNPVKTRDAGVSVPKIGKNGVDITLTTRIEFITESALDQLRSGLAVKVKQSSPCVISVDCGSVHIPCQLPFPVNANASTSRVARKSGWIELTAPLSVKRIDAHNGGYSAAPLPVVRDAASTSLSSWSLPRVNFNRLPRLATPPVEFWSQLFFQTLSDKERSDFPHHATLTSFKVALRDVIRLFVISKERTVRTVGVQVGTVLQMILFFIGFYNDISSHNVVANVYALSITPEIKGRLPELTDIKTSLPGTAIIDWDPSVISFWNTSGLPAMVERCRDWEHTERCQYLRITNGWVPGETSLICSCGVGKVGPEFLKVEEWVKFAPYVTRCAVSPLFPAPFVDQTRKGVVDAFVAGDPTLRNMGTCPSEKFIGEEGRTSCQTCGIVGKLKKCGRCGRVCYCSQECQRKDWAKHKPSCHRDG